MPSHKNQFSMPSSYPHSTNNLSARSFTMTNAGLSAGLLSRTKSVPSIVMQSFPSISGSSSSPPPPAPPPPLAQMLSSFQVDLNNVNGYKINKERQIPGTGQTFILNQTAAQPSLSVSQLQQSQIHGHRYSMSGVGVAKLPQYPVTNPKPSSIPSVTHKRHYSFDDTLIRSKEFMDHHTSQPSSKHARQSSKDLYKHLTSCFCYTPPSKGGGSNHSATAASLSTTNRTHQHSFYNENGAHFDLAPNYKNCSVELKGGTAISSLLSTGNNGNSFALDPPKKLSSINVANNSNLPPLKVTTFNPDQPKSQHRSTVSVKKQTRRTKDHSQQQKSLSSLSTLAASEAVDNFLNNQPLSNPLQDINLSLLLMSNNRDKLSHHQQYTNAAHLVDVDQQLFFSSPKTIEGDPWLAGHHNQIHNSLLQNHPMFIAPCTNTGSSSSYLPSQTGTTGISIIDDFYDDLLTDRGVDINVALENLDDKTLNGLVQAIDTEAFIQLTNSNELISFGNAGDLRDDNNHAKDETTSVSNLFEEVVMLDGSTSPALQPKTNESVSIENFQTDVTITQPTQSTTQQPMQQNTPSIVIPSSQVVVALPTAAPFFQPSLQQSAIAQPQPPLTANAPPQHHFWTPLQRIHQMNEYWAKGFLDPCKYNKHGPKDPSNLTSTSTSNPGSGSTKSNANFSSSPFQGLAFWQQFVDEFFESVIDEDSPGVATSLNNSISDLAPTVGLFVSVTETAIRAHERNASIQVPKKPFFIPRALLAKFFWTMSGGTLDANSGTGSLTGSPSSHSNSYSSQEIPIGSMELILCSVKESFMRVIRKPLPSCTATNQQAQLAQQSVSTAAAVVVPPPSTNSALQPFLLIESPRSIIRIHRLNGICTEQHGNTRLWFAPTGKLIRWEWSVERSFEWRLMGTLHYPGYHGKTMKLVAGFTPRTWAVLELAHLTKTHVTVGPLLNKGNSQSEDVLADELTASIQPNTSISPKPRPILPREKSNDKSNSVVEGEPLKIEAKVSNDPTPPASNLAQPSTNRKQSSNSISSTNLNSSNVNNSVTSNPSPAPIASSKTTTPVPVLPTNSSRTHLPIPPPFYPGTHPSTSSLHHHPMVQPPPLNSFMPLPSNSPPLLPPHHHHPQSGASGGSSSTNPMFHPNIAAQLMMNLHYQQQMINQLQRQMSMIVQSNSSSKRKTVQHGGTVTGTGDMMMVSGTTPKRRRSTSNPAIKLVRKDENQQTEVKETSAQIATTASTTPAKKQVIPSPQSPCPQDDPLHQFMVEDFNSNALGGLVGIGDKSCSAGSASLSQPRRTSDPIIVQAQKK